MLIAWLNLAKAKYLLSQIYLLLVFPPPYLTGITDLLFPKTEVQNITIKLYKCCCLRSCSLLLLFSCRSATSWLKIGEISIFIRNLSYLKLTRTSHGCWFGSHKEVLTSENNQKGHFPKPGQATDQKLHSSCRKRRSKVLLVYTAATLCLREFGHNLLLLLQPLETALSRISTFSVLHYSCLYLANEFLLFSVGCKARKRFHWLCTVTFLTNMKDKCLLQK